MLFFVTGAGAGYFPWFPGTVGTLLAIPLSLALNRMATASFSLSLLTLSAFTVTATWFCKKGEEIFHEKDCRKIVIDEITGFLLANFLSPPELYPTAAAFLLFRFFDIIKVFPAGRAEQIRGGVGVILDDLVAGLYSFLILRLLLLWNLL
ncbi:MAG: phosphatidylglycerophosphatase A [Deltaproteobacteria bacterium]|nr:phosphatidylglycerophosphatase A [Deltaproteobacteria bacterium]